MSMKKLLACLLALMMALALLASLFPAASAEMAPAADTFEQEAQQFLAQQASEELPADLTVGYRRRYQPRLLQRARHDQLKPTRL